MRIRAIPGKELDNGLRQQWREIQQQNPKLLGSPYFCHEYFSTVADVRDDVWVGVMEEGNRVVGFFPFQRKGSHARPVGGKLSDYQAVIAPAEVDWNSRELLKQCRLRSWEFDHLLAEQAPFARYHEVRDESPCMDLSSGFAAYLEQLKKSGSDVHSTTQRKMRKAAREIGDVRYVANDVSREAFECLLKWKSQQYQKSKIVDVFSFDWTIAVLEKIRGTHTPEFSGILSSLYLGDRLAAVHMGMMSRWTWHYWFPAYDVELQQYSPGMGLIFQMAEDAAKRGITTIDLGKGESRYKSQLRSYAVPLAEGRIELPSARTFLRHLVDRGETFVRRSPLYHVARWPGKLVKNAQRRKRFE